MANQDHLDILRQGVDVWNQWRKEHPEVRPELSGVDLVGANLVGADFGTIRPSKGITVTLDTIFDLITTDLSEANLSRANLSEANFITARLSKTILSEANLTGANLVAVELSEANLIMTNLQGASLSGAVLAGANLTKANLTATLFDDTVFRKTDFTQAQMSRTLFINVDLQQVQGLNSIVHTGPSEISINTIYRSKGNIPVDFLRNAGVPDTMIEYMRSLVVKPIDYYSCFISYSSKDDDFAERLHADLQSKGVRCWFAPEDMMIGDNIRSRIDESIRIHDKLLLVLSKNSVESDWVEKEVEAAFEKERRQNKLVLFPIRLDDTVMTTTQAWAADIRRTRHIGDFRQWKNHDDYSKALERLLRDLQAEPLHRP